MSFMHMAKSGALKQMLRNVEWQFSRIKAFLMVNALPHLDYYNYLGVKFTYNGHWDTHIKYLVLVGKRKDDSILKIFCNI